MQEVLEVMQRVLDTHHRAPVDLLHVRLVLRLRHREEPAKHLRAAREHAPMHAEGGVLGEEDDVPVFEPKV